MDNFGNIPSIHSLPRNAGESIHGRRNESIQSVHSLNSGNLVESQGVSPFRTLAVAGLTTLALVGIAKSGGDAEAVSDEAITAEAFVPSESEAKFLKDIQAIQVALDKAVETNGDLGALNHMVAYSPIFQARYDLPGNLEDEKIRYLPPASLLGIEGLEYEFSPGAPDKERLASAPIISLSLYTAYSLRTQIAENPDFSEDYANSCLRVGDLSALYDHDSHHGSQVDFTSALNCDIEGGIELADGPVFWINRNTEGVDESIANPNHNQQLDQAMLDVLSGAHIDGRPIAASVLYNLPTSNPNVKKYQNHSSHVHVNGANQIKSLDLKGFAHGGGRPEAEGLGSLQDAILSDYDNGFGVEGISAVAKESNPTNLEAKEQFDQTMKDFLNFVAEGEGDWDDVNRGEADDTNRQRPEELKAYKKIFGDRMLTDLTIAEVMSLQEEGKIMAAGGIQFVPPTLKSAVKVTGIDTSRKFNAETQIELAASYLVLGGKQPALSAYIKGESDNQGAAIDGMANEWASLVGMDGIGKYNGIAGNHAVGIVKRDAQIAWIELLRQQYSLI